MEKSMTTEIIVAIISAVAVIVAAIIGAKAVRVKKRSEKSDHLEQQIAKIHGSDNDVEQSTHGGNCLQSATIKGNSNFIKQNKK